MTLVEGIYWRISGVLSVDRLHLMSSTNDAVVFYMFALLFQDSWPLNMPAATAAGV